jgi:3'-phosphoadenosine 5'-phosphosulfate (PAPS) 3'-phosphatase
MLDDVLSILTEATLAGAVEVLETRRANSVATEYKDAKELVTTADKRSDAAILGIFRRRFTLLDPSIVFQLEESGFSDIPARRIAGADPLDGTNHFAAGGNLYSVQAHYMEDGLPLVGVVFQPEVYLPLDEDVRCSGRIAYAIRGRGAFMRRSRFTGQGFELGEERRMWKRDVPATRTYVACVPIGSKMTSEDRELAIRVHQSGIIAASTGTGGAGGNVMMAILGGQHVYASFGAGEDLDLIPPQVIAEEAGMTVWGIDRRPPVWDRRKQPFIVAPSPEVAEQFLRAAGKAFQ